VRKVLTRCGYHEQSFPVLRHVGCVLDIDRPTGLRSEPVAGLTEASPNFVEPLAVGTVEQVRDVLKDDQPRTVCELVQFSQQPIDLKEQPAPWVVKPTPVTSLRETLARKAASHEVDRCQTVARD